MLPEGVHHWTATHPEWEGPVSAYAVDDGEQLILIDPIAVPDDVRGLIGSRQVVTVLTSTWHERDAASLGFPVWAPAPDRPEDQLVPATRYAIGDSLFGLEAYPGREGQLDLVLWSERIRAVIAGDTLIDLGSGLEIPASWLPEGVTVEQVATGLRPTARLSNAPSPDPCDSSARPGKGLSDDEHGHDRAVERRERVTKERNPVEHRVFDTLCCSLVELLVVAAKQCPVERTWIEACQVTLTVI